MSGDSSGQPPSSPGRYRTADEIVRSILDGDASASDISPSGELYRAIERYYPYHRPISNTRPDIARNHFGRSSQRSSLRNSMPLEPSSEAQRRFLRELQNPDPSLLYNLPPSAPYLPPLRSLTSTRRPVAMPVSGGVPGGRHARPRSDRYSARLRGAHENRNEAAEEAGEFWERLEPQSFERIPRGTRRSVAEQIPDTQQPNSEGSQEARISDYFPDTQQPNGERSQEARSQLEALLDFTNSSSHPYFEPALSSPRPPPPPQDPTEDNRRAKRRKLDSDRLTSGFQGFRYGKYGQVEPGQLTMELVSCDGGIYSDDGQRYAAENILKNDQSVYCTEGPRCNIVLRHQGNTVFTLKELVIKAPRSNFTSPVQEGMVFVSMTFDHLLNRTAQYQIQYSTSRSSPRRAERESQPLTPIVSIRHNEDGSTMTHAQIRARRLYNIWMEDEDNNVRVAQIPSEFNVPPPFRVTTECSDDEGDEPIPRGDWRPPNRIGSLPFESETSEDEGGLNDYSFREEYHRLRRRRNRSNTALAEAVEAAQVATQEAVRAVGGELMVPHARFFIERNKSKCTIKFDPPVSGRFILLKMWSPHRDPGANIDIQAVIAKGFAGPRYFPSLELR
ncbi:uncharacterized protein F4807DRAFT_411320 [Annulohypoxylon truncatum]|uniref:uncharacterized protein n=1 Tax=Annulohypoxylon truncatum TaxID=327061 RepID=UPI002008978E|nr:uncharacterized protein F4807DRAFT_411320 [Annulohypoxylon truncatum]KAI1213492.1 hypothetical protein F4807DRAFT_411320 [Annulohypoxylon truncatum]